MMAVRTNNRYALFVEKDENVAPTRHALADPARNPFLNQIGDDTAPWEEVKKRTGPQERRAPDSGVITLAAMVEPSKPVINHAVRAQPRDRAISTSTADGSEKPYDPHENWCGVCSQKFSNKASLLSHMKQLPEHQHYCNLCKRVFKDRNGLKNHVDNSWGHETFCNLCLSAFKNSWGLKNHFENNFHTGHQFSCLVCLLGFRSSTELERHLQTAEKHTWCETCHRRFRTQDERDEHWQKTNKHKHCLESGCNFDGPDEAALSQHHSEDHHQCLGCKRIWPSLNKLNAHYDACSFALLCRQCGEICAGKTKLAAHLAHCYLCGECGFQTHHEGNYNIHMTKHSSKNIPCWGCLAPMRTYSSLINHLESGRCPHLSRPMGIMRCLGKWWYSPLYMDIDLHVQLRTGRIDLDEMQQWIKGGVLQPFICRADGCKKTFSHFSSLVLHCESLACGWDVARLNIPGVEAEIKRSCLRKDTAVT